MLFSDILRVNANTSTFVTSKTFTWNCTFSFGGGSTGNRVSGHITNGTGSVSSTGYEYGQGGTVHVKIPFQLQGGWEGSWYPDEMVGCTVVYDGFSVSEGNIMNVGIYDPNGLLLCPSSGASKTYYPYVSDIALLSDGGYNWGLRANYIIEFDYSFPSWTVVGYPSDYEKEVTFTLRNFKNTVYHASDTEVASNTTKVRDDTTSQKLDTLNQSTDAIEQSVTSDTGGGILATIKNFFGSFFQNVFDTLVSVFVPEDGFFSDWFNRLNTLLSEKLGMLYAPFDLLVTTLTAIMNADTTDSGIPFPGIQWEDTYLVEPFTFYFSSLGDTFTDLQGYVYFATDTVLLFAFLYLLQNKIRLILEGHESG